MVGAVPQQRLLQPLVLGGRCGGGQTVPPGTGRARPDRHIRVALDQRPVAAPDRHNQRRGAGTARLVPGRHRHDRHDAPHVLLVRPEDGGRPEAAPLDHDDAAPGRADVQLVAEHGQRTDLALARAEPLVDRLVLSILSTFIHTAYYKLSIYGAPKSTRPQATA